MQSRSGFCEEAVQAGNDPGREIMGGQAAAGGGDGAAGKEGLFEHRHPGVPHPRRRRQVRAGRNVFKQAQFRKHQRARTLRAQGDQGIEFVVAVECQDGDMYGRVFPDMASPIGMPADLAGRSGCTGSALSRPATIQYSFIELYWHHGPYNRRGQPWHISPHAYPPSRRPSGSALPPVPWWRATACGRSGSAPRPCGPRPRPLCRLMTAWPPRA